MQTDVLIVGGGLSGLSIADHVNQAGIDFLLAEASDRLGGRILTETLAGGAFDLGPAWFWPGQPRMAALAKRFGLAIFEQFSSGDLMFQDRSGTIQRGRGYASMQGSYRIDGGMGRLIAALQASLEQDKLLMNRKLVSLQSTGHDIIAAFDGTDSITARHVILAMPPRIIVESVQFNPALMPGQAEAMAQIPTWMAGQAKILAVYEEPYWRKAGLSGDAMSHRGPMVEIHDASSMAGGPYALFGFVGVPADARKAHRQDILSLALTQLTAMFGADMANPQSLVMKDWAAVPEVATARDQRALRAHPSYGLPSSLQTLWDGRLQLASTETARGFGGLLEGALEAADMAAQRVIARKKEVA